MDFKKCIIFVSKIQFYYERPEVWIPIPTREDNFICSGWMLMSKFTQKD